MKYSWIRIFISLLLILVLVINISPIKAEASVAGTVIASASLVSVPVALWAAAALIAIGVTVDWATDPNYNSYDALVNNVSTFLTDAGTYVKDGMVDMYRVVDETGKAVFYAAGDAMESLRSFLLDDGVVVPTMSTTYYNPSLASPYFWSDVPFGFFYFTCSEQNLYFNGVYSSSPCTIYSGNALGVNGSVYTKLAANDYGCPANGYYWSTSYSSSLPASCSSYTYLGDVPYSACVELYPSNWIIGASIYAAGHFGFAYGSSSAALEAFPSVPIDGTGAREWSEEYTNNGLYIVGTGGNGNNNPNDGKWFWPLALGLTAAELYAMSQADQWAGETPSEFSDYEVKEDYSVSPGQEVEFGQSVELTPDPSANPDPGTGTNPDPGISSNGAQSVIDHFTPSGTITDYSLDLSSLFPFCIPFDLYDFLSVLKADPVAPVFEFDLNLGVTSAPICIDLSGWSDLASVVRALEVALFCIGLALKTKELIGT